MEVSDLYRGAVLDWFPGGGGKQFTPGECSSPHNKKKTNNPDCLCG